MDYAPDAEAAYVYSEDTKLDNRIGNRQVCYLLKMSFWQLQFEKYYKRTVVNVKMFSVASVVTLFLVDQPYKAILGEFLVLTKWIIVITLTLRSRARPGSDVVRQFTHDV